MPGDLRIIPKRVFIGPHRPFEKCRFLQPKASHFLEFMGGAVGLNESAIYHSAFPFRVTPGELEHRWRERRRDREYKIKGGKRDRGSIR